MTITPQEDEHVCTGKLQHSREQTCFPSASNTDLCRANIGYAVVMCSLRSLFNSVNTCCVSTTRLVGTG